MILVSLIFSEFGWLKKYIQYECRLNHINIQLQIELKIPLFCKKVLRGLP